MIISIILQILLSLILIIMVHYIYIYFKDNLTVPIVKDLVKFSEKEYNNINSVLSKNKNNIVNNNQDNNNNDDDDTDELREFMNNLKGNTENENNNLEGFDEYTDDNNFSNY